MAVKKREYKGIRLLAKGNGVRQIDGSNFLVCSESDSNRMYRVKWRRNRWTCSCVDYAKNRHKCKHIHAACYYLALRDIQLGTRELSDASPCCPKCNSAEFIIKRGKRYNRCSPVQRYYCKRCGIKFSVRTAFEGIKSKVSAVIAALDLYYRGLSLRQIAQHLESTQSIRVTHGTIYNWIKKYVELVERYVKTLHVGASERWHADETIVKVRGRHLLLWALLDSETRFLIATHVSQSRGAADARATIKKGLERSKNKPLEFVTDGLQSYGKALEREREAGELNHLIHLQGPLSEALNNKMERFFGSVKARVKPMCRFNSKEGVERFANGYAIFYNFIKSHKALNGKTPAQAIELMSNKSNWLDLILKAKKSARSK